MTDHTDWWFTAVEETFGFLVTDRGFKVAERSRHFQGNYIVFSRSDVAITIECAPDWNSLTAWVDVVDPDGNRTESDLAELLDRGDPRQLSRYIADSGPLDREAVVTKMSEWADGFRGWIAVKDRAPDP